MRDFRILFFVWLAMLQLPASHAAEIKFVSSPPDSQLRSTYCWQPGNAARPLLRLDGEWEYKLTETGPLAKVTLPAGCNYDGEIIFRKSFVPDSMFVNHFFRLVCYGINYYCRIFINEKLIGSHSGGYSSFAFDIADGIIHLNQKNLIEIKVDTRLDPKKTIPHRFQPDAPANTAGIFRSLYLLGIPENSIEEVALDYYLTPDFSRAEISVDLQLKDRIDNISDQMDAKSSVEPLSYDIILSEKNSGKIVFQERKELDRDRYVLTSQLSVLILLDQPQLWSPESPFLYSLQVRLIQKGNMIDQFDQILGIKQLEYRAGDIYLNGKRLVLKGVNWSENYLSHGAVFDRSQLLKDLDLVKQLYANAIRVLNHPPHPWLTTICDSLGLLVFQEIPLNGMPILRIKSDIFISQSSDYLNEMVKRDRAHVSMLGWGIGGNFVITAPQSKIFMNRMIKAARANPGQFFYFYNAPPLPAAAVDSGLVAGLSIFNVSKKQLRNELEEWIRQNEGQINLVLSFGAPQLSLSSNSDQNALYEEYQVLQIVEAWRTMARFPQIDGYFIASLSDYQGSYASTLFKNVAGGNLRPFGLTDSSQKKRVAFETIRSLYQEGNTNYNAGIDIKDELPTVFTIVGIGTILVFLFMVNSRRYFRENLKRIFIHPHGFYVDIRDGRKIAVSHTIAMALFISIGGGMMMASLLSFVKNQPAIDHLLTLLFPIENLKMKLCYLSWNPDRAILIFTSLCLLLMLLIAIYFKLMAILARKRCSFAQALTISFWTGANLILFVPLGMILFRVLQYQSLIFPMAIVSLCILWWFIFRMVKGMRVMYVWTIYKAFLVFIMSALAILAAMLYYYQYHYALIDYVKFYYQSYGSQMFTAHPF